jgi:Bacterial SH3 domain
MKRLFLGFWLATMATSAWAETCVVTDPTGTPLNVRVRPNGAIVGALHNGAPVRILDVTSDDRGSRWAYIAPLDAGKRGWVFASYVTCR